ncbi:hypothetical protein LDO31_16260 [Luteimonas sp. XNQY3]|nr:hypothetical protein [Luteimonas sp. XNQY3]MCD9007756.1 hypothetical protein [Luteimonas sp. XNQY3]
MYNVRLPRPGTLLPIVAIAAMLTGCSGNTGDDAPGALAPDAAAAPSLATPAPAPGTATGEVRFLSGTSYAATGAQAEIALDAREERAGDVLQRIAEASDVPLDIADGVNLDHKVTLDFNGIPIGTVLKLLGQGTDTEIAAEADAIRVRRATPAS